MAEDSNKSALLLIEFQNEWLSPEGKLYTRILDRDLFENSQKNAKQCLSAARQAKMPIIHSGLSFQSGYNELGSAEAGIRAGIKRRETFLKGSVGSEFHNDFMPTDGEFVTSGRIGSSAFCGSNLDTYLKRNHINKLYLMGYALQVCVESTMREAHDAGYDVVIIDDACAAFTQEIQHYVLEHVIPHFGSSMTSVAFLSHIKNL